MGGGWLGGEKGLGKDSWGCMVEGADLGKVWLRRDGSRGWFGRDDWRAEEWFLECVLFSRIALTSLENHGLPL